MAREVSQMSGLETDLPPDQAGNQALRISNLIPGSAISMRPRPGTSQVAYYEPVLSGRVVLVDALPFDETNGMLVVCQNNLNVFGRISHWNDRLIEWRPSGQSNDLFQALGTQPGTRIYGVFAGKFKILDYISGTYEDMTPDTETGFTSYFPFFLRPATYNETGTPLAQSFNFPSGLMLIGGTKGTPVPSVRVHAFDVASSEESNDTNLQDSTTGTSTAFNVGGCNLGFPYSGFVFWWNDGGDGTPRVRVVLNTKYNLPLEDVVGMGTVGFTLTNADVLTGAPISDMTPLSRARQAGLLVSKYSTVDHDPATAASYQLLLIQQAIQLPTDGTDTLTFNTVAKKNYTAVDWVTWQDRPDTCLDAQEVLLNSRVNAGRIVALFGNWIAPTLHKVVDNPRLALLNGVSQTGTGVLTGFFGSSALNVINSHTDGDYQPDHTQATTASASTGSPSGSTVTWIATGTQAVTSTTLAASAKSTYLKATNYGFTIPSGSAITYMAVKVTRRAVGGAASLKDNVASLIFGGSVVGNNVAGTTFWGTDFEQIIYAGFMSSYWGLTGKTGADVNSTNFGFALSAINDGSVAASGNVVQIEITAIYDGNAFHGHGMVADQNGYAYACGTGDFVTNTAGYLILKYNPADFTVPIARVAHGSNGLGDYYTDPLDTHICNIMLDGNVLIVQDIDPVKTRLFIYDLDLNFIGTFTYLSGTSAPEIGQAAANVMLTGLNPWTPTQVPGAGVVSNNIIGGSLTDQLVVTGFGFNLPSDATILGVSVSISRKTDANGAADNVVQLFYAAATHGDNKADTMTSWPSTFGAAAYGGTADTWGDALTPAIVNASGFGVALVAGMDVTSAPQTATVQSMTITLTYSTSSTAMGPVLTNKFSTKFFGQNY